MSSTQKRVFPEKFMWGTATASYQVEGAVTIDGRGESIWDRFSKTPGAVKHGHTGDVAVDQYHRYKEDVVLMHELGVGAYRFSLAWPRIMPAGSGAVREAGIDYYKRLSDELHANNIKAVATLYHWDLPVALEDAGGWPHRDTAYRFADYAAVCLEALKDHVDMWITLNEPWCSAVLGYGYGMHAPGKKNISKAWAAAHHLLLGHGLVMKAYREEKYTQPIGISLNVATPRPATRRAEDAEAVDRFMDLATYMFLNPLLAKPYPQRHFDAYPEAAPPPVHDGDMNLIACPVDFLGVNYYFELAISATPPVQLEHVEHAEESHIMAHSKQEQFYCVESYHPKTDMDWPIAPEGLSNHLQWIWQYCDGRFPLYVTENGCAMQDVLINNRCHDIDRIEYLKIHLGAVLDAVEAGVTVDGYFLWSFIDNFEWTEGYTKRFGIVYVDYINQRRIRKDSFYFYRELINGHVYL